MIILNAQQLQRMAEMLQQVERQQEPGGGEALLLYRAVDPALAIPEGSPSPEHRVRTLEAG